MYILRNVYYRMVCNMAKNRDKMKAHQLENGGIKCSVFTLWNIMKPFKRITAILTNLEGLPRDSPEGEKVRKVYL